MHHYSKHIGRQALWINRGGAKFFEEEQIILEEDIK
jgi:hypothetical protein